MDRKNWLKIVVAASLFLGVGQCCRHYKLFTTNGLSEFRAQRKTAAVDTSFVYKSGDSSSVILDSLTRKNGYVELNWKLLATTTFKPKYIDSLMNHVSFPTFSVGMKQLDGQLVTMRGYVIPVEETGDEQVLVLSKNPYSMCFFCGQAGPESIMDIKLKNGKGLRRFKKDEQVTFRGKLKLNDTDFYFFNFILEEAELAENS
jgi:hypothetical protein